MKYIKKISLKIISIIILVWLFIFPIKFANAADTNQTTWNFSSAEDFNISDESKVAFFDDSVKIAPTGLEKAWGKIWHDNHFAPDLGSSRAFGIAADSEGYIYFGGITRPDATPNIHSDPNTYGFIAKVDQDLNEIWYQQYFQVGGYGGVHRLAIASDGNLVAGGDYLIGSDAYFRLMKINSANGNVIWQQTRAKAASAGINIHADGVGPVIDNNGNIYYAQLSGFGGIGDVGPIEILKFDSTGSLLWSRSEDLIEGRAAWNQAPYYDDLWDMVVDSQGSVYISVAINNDLPVGLNYGLVKYDTNGNLIWRKNKDMFDRWDSPRGIAIDSEDIIYQNGNTNSGCGIRKIDKNGNILYEDILTDYSETTYCWGSVMSQFNNWIMSGQYNWDVTDPGTYLMKYRGSDLANINLIDYIVSPRLDPNQGPTHATVDRCSKAYGLSFFKDNNYSEHYSVVVLKGINTYPNTIPGVGTPITLVNKAPVAFTALSGFSDSLGCCDESDVGYQISNNGQDWYWWNGSLWAQTTYDTNTAEEINARIAGFAEQFSVGDFYFKAFLITDGTRQVDLASVTVLYANELPATGHNNNTNNGTLIFIFYASAPLILLFLERSLKRAK